MALIGTINSGNNLNFKNKLINGNFDFWQRLTTGTATSIWEVKTADRWGGHFDSGASGVYSRSTNVPDSASTYSMRMTGASGGTSAYLDQRVEASEMREIIAKGAVTISGWVRRVGSPTATLSLNLICPTASDNYSSYTTHGAVFTVNNTITGNASAGSSAMTLTDNSTWYYFTMTDTSIASRTNIANGAQFYFAIGGMDANTKYFEFARIQVEAGTVATPFEFRPPAVELTMCQRYYEKSWKQEDLIGSAHGVQVQLRISASAGFTNYLVISSPYKVTKRTTSPTMIVYDSSGNAGKINMNDSITDPNNITPTGYGTVGDWGVAVVYNASINGISFAWSSNAEL
jgi:hypothetical protein